MNIPNARRKLEEAEFFRRTLREYLHNLNRLNEAPAHVLNIAGFYFSAFMSATDSVFDVINIPKEQRCSWRMGSRQRIKCCGTR